jgi:hypothetical protein
MRAASRARWATCALAISICAPALADRRSLASCTTFDQREQADAKIAFTIHNTCTIPVDCAISWRLVCAPGSRKRRASHPGSAKFALAANTGSDSAEASVAVCGDDAWTIDEVRWTCQPNKD